MTEIPIAPGRCYVGDCRAIMADMAAAGIRARTCVTSPPYWGLRDYGVAEQVGLEPTLEEWVATMVDVCRAIREVLTDDGTLWLNLGDSYFTPRWGGDTGSSSTINGKGTQAAFKDAQRRRSLKGESVDSSHQVISPSRGFRDAAPQLKPKDLVGQPWRVALALQEDGWWLRQDIIWHKPSPMPESVTDRFTKAHEYLFLLTKRERYYFDQEAVLEPAVTGAEAIFDPGDDGLGGEDRKTGKTTRRFRKPVGGHAHGPGSHEAVDHARLEGTDGRGTLKFGRGSGWRDREGTASTMRNRRSVWTVASGQYAEAHFATYPPALIEPCILAGSEPGDIVLDPFMGSGTTAQVAEHLGRQWIGCEINPAYLELQRDRLRQTNLPLV